MDPYPHAFEGPLRRHGVGNGPRVLWYVVLSLPPAMEGTLPFTRFPRLRVEGEVADVPVSGAWMPAGDGRRYFIVSPAVRKAAGAGIGDVVPMRFAVADQDAVEVPPALLDALQRQPDALASWQTLTPGKRRGLTYPVAVARTDATRARRVAAVLDTLLDRDTRR